ncbi:hypothetical protein L2E82_40304 [Cichorium intybus]|uniref:Uncharacterized protein n=1 Tax=Cichorium intybus TaxID=13427 RepID=A0ACB9AL97_CICIN|nr:hypothetical protein L2E82_40304 [Cichorium intybus]
MRCPSWRSKLARSESSEDVSLMRLEFERYNLSTAERIELDKKALEDKQRVREPRIQLRKDKQRLKDIKFFTSNPKEGLEGEAREMVLKLKADIMAKYCS